MPWIITAVVVVAVIAVIVLYNGLVGRRKEVDNAWAQIDVQLKRRCDLIPNLVETVKGYAAHESGVLERVTQARSAAIAPHRDTAGRIEAESNLSGALRNLMIHVEAYPQLKANQNFLALQEELTSTENRITFARQHYNDTATDYNTAIALFPACIFASMFNFREAPLWQITEAADREVPKVKF
ncbi:MAG: LemA family protein [Lentisphaeria bacterium]|nr:LemA family protein [Lentisphaeria bacterium]